jgi:hypothetical protein
MRIVALGLVAALLAGCGSSSSAGSRPPARIVTTKSPACHAAVQKLFASLSLDLKAGKSYESLIAKAYRAGAYGGSVDGIVAKERAARRMVSQATRLVNDARPGLADC